MKRIWILAIASAVLLTGCASEQAKETDSSNALLAADGGAETEIALEYDEPDIADEDGSAGRTEVLTEPPVLRIEAVDEMIASCMNMSKGSWSWEYDNGNGEMTEIVACGLHPCEFSDISASFDPAKLVKNPKILLTNGAEIRTVLYWDKYDGVEVKFSEDGELFITDDIRYGIYSVDVEYPQGSCTYVFETVEKGTGSVSDSSGNTASVPPSVSQTSMGCDPVTEMPEETEPVQLPGSIMSDPPQYTQTPPELTAFFVENDVKIEFEPVMGTYTWTYYDDNGSLTTVCFDMAINQQGLPRDFSTDTEIVFVDVPEGAAIADVICYAEDGDEQAVNFTNDMILFGDQPIGEVYCIGIKFENGSYCTYWFAASRAEFLLCGYPKLEEHPDYDLDALYKPTGRISAVTWDEHMPPTALIRSLDELKAYYTANLANEWTAFEDCFSEYDGAFFKENVLVISYFDESSGSISHEYLGIDNESGCIVVKRTTPEIGTCDMAAYVLTVEIPADKALESYSIVFDNIYEWGY